MIFSEQNMISNETFSESDIALTARCEKSDVDLYVIGPLHLTKPHSNTYCPSGASSEKESQRVAQYRDIWYFQVSGNCLLSNGQGKVNP